MAGPLVWTARASADIEAIVRYIARRNPQAATSIGLGIYHRAQLLLTHPQAVPLSTSCAMAAGASSFTAVGR